MDWSTIYFANQFSLEISLRYERLPVVFNRAFVTGLYSALCCWAFIRLSRGTAGARYFLLAGGFLLFIGGALEIHHQFTYYYPATELYAIYLLLYTYSFVLLFSFFSTRAKDTNLYPVNAALLGGCVVLYLLFIPLGFDVQRDMLEGKGYSNHFFAHWVADVLIGIILYRLIGWQRTGKIKIDPALFAWIAGCVTVIFFSAEGQLRIDSLFYSKENSLT